MQEAFKEYWNKRLEEFPHLDDADKLEALAAFEAAYNIEIWSCNFFKYEIGDNTNKGIIKERYYMEFEDRNSEKRNGIYYTFEDENSYNERLIKKI